MLDYVFFDRTLRDRFVDYLRGEGVPAESSDGDGFLASLPDDLDDELSERIEHRYEVLLQENAELLEETGDALEINAAGVRVILGDGTPCTIRFPPDLLARLLQSITMDELRDMVQTIAAAVENPDDRPLCHCPPK